MSIRSKLLFSRLSRQSVLRLAEIEAESNRPPWSKELFEGEFKLPHSYIFGMRIDDRLVGFLITHLIESDSHIVNFAVEKDSRGKGVGRSLLESTLQELKKAGAKSITLEVRKGNTAPINLYTSLGFQSVGIREKYYSDDREDALVMKLVL